LGDCEFQKKEHPMKEVVDIHHCTDREVLAGDFPEKVLIACRAMKPFVDYLNEAIQ